MADRTKKSNEKLRLIGRFFTGAGGFFAAAVVASFATTALNALMPQIFRLTMD